MASSPSMVCKSGDSENSKIALCEDRVEKSVEWLWSSGSTDFKQTVQEITVWDQEQVRKSSWTQVFTLFVNSIQRREKNIYKEEPRILPASLGANSFRKDWSKIRNCGLIYQNLKLLLEIRDTVLRAKEEREYPACNQFKCHHLWWYRNALEHIVDNVHSCEGTFNTERYTSICHHDKVFFFQGSETRPKSILHVLQQNNCIKMGKYFC